MLETRTGSYETIELVVSEGKGRAGKGRENCPALLLGEPTC